MAVTNVIELVNEAFEMIFEQRAAPGQRVSFAVSLCDEDFDAGEGPEPALMIFISLEGGEQEGFTHLTCRAQARNFCDVRSCIGLANGLWERLQAKVLERSLMSMGSADDE